MTVALNLDALTRGMPGISPKLGAALAEAASLCFEDHGHASGILLPVDGDYEETAIVTWPAIANIEQVRRTWADEQVAVEHGAYAVAALLAQSLVGVTVVERSRKGTGFDYWLARAGTASALFQDKMRLEVSGIGKGTESSLAYRVRRKMAQTTSSDATGLPALIAVVEFGAPRSRLRSR